MADDKLKTGPEPPGPDRPGDAPAKEAPPIQEPPVQETDAPGKTQEPAAPGTGPALQAEQSVISGILAFRNFSRKCQHDAPGKLGVPLVLHSFYGVPERCPVCISGRRMGRQHDLGVDKFFLLVVEFRFLVVLAE